MQLSLKLTLPRPREIPAGKKDACMTRSKHQNHTKSLAALPSATPLNEQHLPAKESSLFPQFTGLFDSSPTLVFLNSFFWVNECTVLQCGLPPPLTPRMGPEDFLFQDSLVNPLSIEEVAILWIASRRRLQHQARTRSLNSTEHTVGLDTHLPNG